MEKKTNIRGTIRNLKPGEFIDLAREQARPSYVRSLCSTLYQGYLDADTVNTLDNGKFRVTRNA